MVCLEVDGRLRNGCEPPRRKKAGVPGLVLPHPLNALGSHSARDPGVLLFLAVVFSFALRIATRRMDPSSLSSRLYVAFFAVLNRCGLPWYRLPTFLGILNLGALRDVMREKNLVGTEDIPVTNPQGR